MPRLLLAVVRPFRQFFRTQAAGGVVLIVATTLALAWANSRYARSYHELHATPLSIGFGARAATWTLHHFINDALMTVFFLVAGLEIKREILVGELRTVRRALLPAFAALGGMLVPAAIHFGLNHAGPARSGWGVPMATDIAFALGCLALVARRVPASLVVFLMALAIFDDLGAIVVIALFYGANVDLGALVAAGAITAALFVLTRLRVVRVWPYLLLGGALWIAVLRSGVHATVAGVILGLSIPARAEKRPSEVLIDVERAVAQLRHKKESDLDAAGPVAAIERHLEAVQPPLDRLVHGLHGWVAFLIVPVFAVANAGVEIASEVGPLIVSRPSLGVSLGLFFGKPIGIFGATLLAIRLKLAPRPTGASYPQIFGVSVLAGIGFTMSIFVATLAFPGAPLLQDESKIGIFAGSFASALVGLGILARSAKPAAAVEVADAPDVDLLLDLPRFAEGYLIEPWVVAGPSVGLTLGELELRSRFGVTALGVNRGGRASSGGLEPVGASYALAAGDTLLLVGDRAAIDGFFAAQAGATERNAEDQERADEVPSSPAPTAD
ncbi:MAG: Na+/H+ antiporter NhaA [Polyangiaceae bacterium]